MGKDRHNVYIRLPRRFWLSGTSHAKKWISAAGGFLGILAVLWSSSSVLDNQGAAMIIASMGASAVLLFAVPHGTLSQPWPVLGGHMISAIIGVTCAQQISAPYLSAPLAVGLAILAMYYLRCLHPPGGATALVAVLGGESVQQLGYHFLLTPVLENALVILLVAVLVNLPFRGRRYPLALSETAPKARGGAGEKAMIAHSDLVYALSQLDSFIDVSEQDLIRIYALAVRHQDPVSCLQNGEKCAPGNANCFCRHVMGEQAPAIPEVA